MTPNQNPSLKIKILSEPQVTCQLDREIKNILCTCFPNDTEIYSRSRGWYGCEPFITIILRDNNKTFACLVIIERTIKIGTTSLYTAGIANVAILPEYRKKGFGNILLKTTAKEIASRSFDIGLLFTSEPIKKVYARNGWMEIKNRAFTRTYQQKRIIMPEDTVKMYYPLKISSLGEGDFDLCGNDW
jgi:GNAT superfamily N-acetyltransferase